MISDLDILITCDAAWNVGEARLGNRRAFASMGAKVTVVIVDRQAPSQVPGPAHSVVFVRQTQFRKALGINVGAMRAKGKYLLILDADILVSHRTLSAMKTAVDLGYFVTVRKVKSSASKPQQPADFSYVVDFPDDSVKVTSFRRFTDGARSGPGLVMLRRRDFIKVGGMNSDLFGWGWEDIDLLVRLHKSGLRRRAVGQVRHLGESVITYETFAKRQVSEQRNIMKCIKKYQAGNFLGCLKRDMMNVRPQELHVAAS